MFIRLKKTFQLSILTLSLISCQTQVLSFGTPDKAQTTHSGDPVSTEQTQINLPYVYSSAGFSDNPAIWVHAGTPSNPEVALFRHTFTTESPVAPSELQIFADTRYEVWFDGEWVGRGPARFSKLLHEYDLYELGTLDPGEHLIAVLVQWAPNTRRSESEFPLLKAQMEGKVNQASQIITATGPDWKTLLSGAWRDDSTPVHAWGIIGPTELLDLRTLDPDWNQPEYPDSLWANAVVLDFTAVDSPPVYKPRSIEPLVNVPFPARLIDAGLLSPDLKIAELVPPVSEPFTLNLQVSNSTTLTIETLLDPGSTGITIQLDGGVLVWESAGENRPDVYRAAMGISVGPHELVFDKVPSTGFTFGVSTQDITYPNLPFEQGVHAGRRLLLAEPISDPGQVISYTNPSGLTLEPLNLPSYVVLDLGRTVHGRLSAEVTGSAGSIVDIGWDERLATDYDRPLPYPGTLHPEWNQVDSWILDGTTRSISTIDARAGRYILIAAWGDGPVRLDGIQIHEERYPADQLGEFTSSNPLLDQIWQLGVDTAQVNMTDAYADPWRERGQWWGDAYIVDHVNRVAFGETDLLMRGVNSMANALKKDDSPGVAPNNNGLHMLDYTMLWVHSLDEYLLQTDDVEVLNKTYPQLIQFMDHLSSFENPQTSLLDLPDRPWGETAYIDTFGHFSRYGQSTALNAIYYSTLLNASEIALQKGEATDSTAWKNKADLIKDSLNTHLYLPSEHRYITHIFEGEPYAPSAYSQAWPLAYGIVPPGEVDSVVESLLELLSTDPSYPNVNIYGMYWVLEALARTGYIPEALGIIELYYGHLLDNGASTLWEHFNSYLYHNASLSHGWGGAATWFLTTHVLGASSTGPNSWIVKPAFTGVDTASGSLPLNDGILWVDWERKTCNQGTLNISSDTNTSGDVFIPFHDPSLQITLDGQIIWQDNTTSTDFVTSSDSGITISIDGGSHEISILMDC